METPKDVLKDTIENLSNIKQIIVIYVDKEDRLNSMYSATDNNIKTVGYLEVAKDMIKENLLAD